MGNKTLTQQASCQILTKYWDPITSGLYRNRSTHETIRQKKLAFRTEQEMKYVFNCLLKRMNNTHSNVIKVVYLRKFTEDASLCDCGSRYVILVYVEHLQLKLKQYLVKQRSIGNIGTKTVDNMNAKGTNKCKGSQVSVISNSLTPYRKCLCVSILRAAEYLKQRYGSFKLTADNIWLQPYTSINSQSRIQTQPQPCQLPNPPNFKAKVWISGQQEQNFPDQSCQQKQMCHSILQLLQQHIIQANLCKCYMNGFINVMDRYRQINSVKQLSERIVSDHGIKDTGDGLRSGQNQQNGYVTKRETLVCQRGVRSFSSYEPGQKGFQGNVIQRLFEGQAGRKYTSIEVGRARGEGGGGQRGNVQNLHNWVSLNGHTQQSSPNDHPLPQYMSLNNHHINQSPAHSNPSIKPSTPMHQNQCCLPFPLSITLPQSHSTQPANNRPYSHHLQKPILSIADFAPAPLPSRIPCISLTPTLTPTPTPPNIQPPPSLIHVQLNNNHTKPTSASLDKTHPTDRTKDISLKQQSKKQVEGLVTSRKNISIVPISLQSTYGAGSGIKQLLHSYDNVARQRDVNNQRASIDFNYQGKDQDEENRKESASSSKSEQGYCSGGQQRGKTQREKFWGKRRRDRMVGNEEKSRGGHEATVIDNKQPIEKEHNPTPNHPITTSQNYPKTQPPSPNRPKVQTLSLTSPNEDLIRLRQSQYIISGQNSFMNSKHQSRKQSKQVSEKLQASKKLTSLAEMQAKFHTVNRVESAMQSREHHDPVNSSRLGSEGTVKSNERIEGKMVTVEEIVRVEGEVEGYNRVMSVEKLEELKEKSSREVYEVVNDVMQPITIPAIPIGSYSHHSSNVTSSVRQKALSSNKVSSFIMRQPQQPISHPNPYPHPSPTQQSQQLSPTPTQKLHQKTHSNPTFAHNPITKNKSLKQQFSNILDFPKENSFKAFTENKEKLLTLDQKEGRYTYSIYNESEYGESRGQSQRELKSTGNDKLPPHHTTGQKSKWRKPFSKQQLEKEIQQKKLQIQKEAQQLLRLTSSGHQDNSIKQKVRNKKAEFAQLKNQMNSLLL